MLVGCAIDAFASLDRPWGVGVFLAIAAVFLALVLPGIRRRGVHRPPPPPEGSGPAAGW